MTNITVWGMSHILRSAYLSFSSLTPRFPRVIITAEKTQVGREEENMKVDIKMLIGHKKLNVYHKRKCHEKHGNKMRDKGDVNPLHHKISMHFLHTVFYTFSKVLTRRICFLLQLTIISLILMTLMCDSVWIL